MAEKYNDMKSADEIDIEKLLESTDSEKIVLDDVLGKYKNGMFELSTSLLITLTKLLRKGGLVNR